MQTAVFGKVRGVTSDCLQVPLGRALRISTAWSSVFCLVNVSRFCGDFSSSVGTNAVVFVPARSGGSAATMIFCWGQNAVLSSCVPPPCPLETRPSSPRAGFASAGGWLGTAVWSSVCCWWVEKKSQWSSLTSDSNHLFSLLASRTPSYGICVRWQFSMSRITYRSFPRRLWMTYGPL